jgi:acyl carrier protein
VREFVVREIAERLRIAVADLSLDVPLERLGFDSLQATELQAKLHAELGVRMPVMRFLGFSSAQTIADEVADRFEKESLIPSHAPEPSLRATASDLETQPPLAITDDGVLEQLGNESSAPPLSNSDVRIRAASPHTEGQAPQGNAEGAQAVGRFRR